MNEEQKKTFEKVVESLKLANRAELTSVKQEYKADMEKIALDIVTVDAKTQTSTVESA